MAVSENMIGLGFANLHLDKITGTMSFEQTTPKGKYHGIMHCIMFFKNQA